MKMLHALVISLLFASLLTPQLAAQQTTQSYSVHFYAFYFAGPSHDHTAVISVDGNNVATDAFNGSGELTATITLDGSSPHTITASLSDAPPLDYDPHSVDNPSPANHGDLYGGSLYVNGNRCAWSDEVWSMDPLSCAFGAGQPVPNLSNGLLTIPMALILLLGAFAVFKKERTN